MRPQTILNPSLILLPQPNQPPEFFETTTTTLLVQSCRLVLILQLLIFVLGNKCDPNGLPIPNNSPPPHPLQTRILRTGHHTVPICNSKPPNSFFGQPRCQEDMLTAYASCGVTLYKRTMLMKTESHPLSLIIRSSMNLSTRHYLGMSTGTASSSDIVVSNLPKMSHLR